MCINNDVIPAISQRFINESLFQKVCTPRELHDGTYKMNIIRQPRQYTLMDMSFPHTLMDMNIMLIALIFRKWKLLITDDIAQQAPDAWGIYETLSLFSVGIKSA